MRSHRRHLTLKALRALSVLLLFCIQLMLCGKFCLGQVGITWDPSYASGNSFSSASFRPLGMNNLNSVGSCTGLDVDASDANEVQRTVLFDYYNANRFEVYSADGVNGWDTDCYVNPMKQFRRRKQSWQNIDSHLGPVTTGSVWVEPFPKRAYGMATTYQTPQSTTDPPKPAAHDHQRTPHVAPELPTTELPTTELPTTELPTTELPTTDLPPIESLDSFEKMLEQGFDTDDLNSHESMFETDKPTSHLPSAEPIATPEPDEEYQDAVGDLPPEFEWDESLLDELPELNRTDPSTSLETIHPSFRQSLPQLPKGNPLPPASGNLNTQSRVNPGAQRELFAPPQPQSSVRFASPQPQSKNPLREAIRLQTLEAAAENALQSAIQLQSLDADLEVN